MSKVSYVVGVVASVAGPGRCLRAKRAGRARSSGYVFDEGGMPLKGIKVTATSPTQIGGAKVRLHQRRGRLPHPAAVARQLRGAGLGAQAGDRRPEGRRGRHQLGRPS